MLQDTKRKRHVEVISYLRTATSFLNALNCSGVGSFTFKTFTATSPIAKIFFNYPKL